MLAGIQVRNFKSIKNLELKCKNLNLLTGTNSSGKSTICQAILLAGQNMETASGLNGSFLSLGELEENVCKYSAEKEIQITLEDGRGVRVSKRLYRGPEGRLYLKNGYDRESDEYIKKEFVHQFDRKERMLQYLSCHRVGPQNLYKKNMSMDESVGNDGEYAVSYLNRHGEDLLEENLQKGKSDYTLLGQVNWWLEYISGATVSTEEIPGADSIKASYQMNELSGIRPINIGAGISYLISVLIMCLSAPPESVAIIENPEIHLHPGAQSRLCEFFYFIAESGRQLFIESHSDHIFNGFRAGIVSGKMKETLIDIYFTYLNDDHTTEAMEVKVGKFGNIENQRPDQIGRAHV